MVAQNIRNVLCALRESDVLLHTQPLSHGTHSFILPGVQAGCEQVIADSTRAGLLAEQLQRLNVSVLKCVPTLLRRLVTELSENPKQLPALRQIVCGASALDAALVRDALEVFGPVLSQSYGQTEAPVTITYMAPQDYQQALNSGEESALSTVGRPYPGVEVAILDPGGQARLSPGEVGEVGVRSAIVAEWEWAGQQVIPLDGRRAGYHLTGDFGRLDADGRLHLMGRKDGVIISGGFNVYPAEVRNALLQVPGVAEAEVFGVRHAEWGHQVTAAVVAPSGADPGMVIAGLRERLAAYKVPKEVLVLQVMPLTVNGKPDIRELTRLASAQAYSGRS